MTHQILTTATSFAEVDYIDLTFSDFYNGDYKETEGTVTNLKTGEVL